MTKTVRDYQRLVASPDHVTEYFRELFAAADTNIEDGDNPEVQLAKLAKQGQILSRMIDLAQTPAFQDVHRYLADTARRCEAEVFEAIIKGDQAGIMRLAILREGIVRFFDTIEMAVPKRDNITEQILDLKEAEKNDSSEASEQ